MNSALLIARSDFSFGEGIISVSDYVATAAGKGHTVLGLADTMTVSSMPAFVKACKTHEITPVIGCRIRCVDDSSLREKKVPEFYPMIWPKNQAGWEQLLLLLTIATDADHFYYKPRVSWREVLKYGKDGNWIVSTGDVKSLAENPEWCEAGREALGKNFWKQYQAHDGPYFKGVNAALLGITGELMYTRPVLYPEGKVKAFDTMAAIINHTTITKPWRTELWYDDLHVLSPDEVNECFADWRVESAAVKLFLDQAKYKFEPLEVSLPDMSEGGKTEVQMLKEKCIAGWSDRLQREIMGYKPTSAQQAEYKERLTMELKAICSMNFERYFLLVEDLTTWARKAGILIGPGRGSVGGSLVAYLLGITDVDPIRHGLLFERFINPDRLDLPDADLDFQSSRRHEIGEYLKEKYGPECVAGIVNFNTIASKGALRDVGRVFEVPQKIMFVSKLVPDEAGGKSMSLEDAKDAVPGLESFAEKFPQVWENAVALQGTNRTLGRHAAGIVVAGEPLVSRAVVDYSKDEPAVGFDKRTVEDMGLVKMDILGLSNLDVLQLALQYIHERKGKEIDLYDIRLDDKATLEAFSKADTAGVFQFESPGMRKLLSDLSLGVGTLTFDHLTATTSLYRPGPKESGLLDDYVAIQQGLKMPTYAHPCLEPVLAATDGVIIYQEQVSALCKALCGFSGADADHIRKAMGKKDPIAMAKWRDRFVDGAEATSSFPRKTAEKLFNQIEMFAGYAFNKSHAVEYTIISFWTMYLKVHYPEAFYAATLSILKEEKLENLVRAAEKNGIKVLPPEINTSTNRFEIFDTEGGPVLISPFNRVKQISDKTANHLIEVRIEGGFFKSLEDLEERTTGRVFNKRHKANLRDVGAFVNIEGDDIGALDKSRLPKQLELMPGLMISIVKSDRTIAQGKKDTARLITEVIKPCETCDKCDLAGSIHPVPRLGGKASFMVITDCPNFSEENDNKMLSGKASNYVREAITKAGLTVGQGYFTSLVKAKKIETLLSNEQINGCKPFLELEIDILKPPIIIMLGNSVIRELASSIKPGADSVGKVIYDPERECSMFVGFNPAAITFDSGKQDILNDLFAQVAEAIS